MPVLGEIKRAIDVGYKGTGLRKVMWVACPDCGKERWVQIVAGIPRNTRCQKCAAIIKPVIFRGKTAEKSLSWRGGKSTDTNGYIMIYVRDDDFFAPMVTCAHYIPEHRLVMAKNLGRCLHTWETVHHLNGDKHDNRIENLQLLSPEKHDVVTRFNQKVAILTSKINNLKQEVSSLKKVNTELRIKLNKCHGNTDTF